jgi:hypothetical protein
MRRVAGVMKREVVELLPAVVYFVLAFNIIVLTDALTTESYGIRVFSFVSATVLALVVAKAVLLVNLLPFMNVFASKPLIYITLWRTALYVLAATVLRYLEQLIPHIARYGSFSVANRHMIVQVNWPRFWAVHIWLAVLFLVFSAITEISRALGPGRLKRMFFGREASDED